MNGPVSLIGAKTALFPVNQDTSVHVNSYTDFCVCVWGGGLNYSPKAEPLSQSDIQGE